MPRMPRKQSESEIYHVISRGTGQQLIFEDDVDRERYVELLSKNLRETGGRVLAWCLMGNHVHLLLQMPLCDLAAYMGKVNSVYAIFFNQRHGRQGHLFQDRFKSEPVNDNEYFLIVLRYIHMNPVKGGLSVSCAYRWSSYDEYLGKRRGFVDTSLALDMLNGLDGFRRFHAGSSILDWRVLETKPHFKGASDEKLLADASLLLGGRHPSEVKALPREERDEAVRMMKAAGMTVRQIQRLTGISLGSISAACRSR